MLLLWAELRDRGFYCAPLGSGAPQAGVQHILVLIRLLWAASARASPVTFPDFPLCGMGRLTRTSLKLASNDQLRDNGLESMNSRRIATPLVGPLKATCSLVVKSQGSEGGA